MKITGIVDQINRTNIMGWIAITLPIDQPPYDGAYAEVELLIDGVTKSKTLANLPRVDVSVQNGSSFGFSLDIPSTELKLISLHQLKIIARVGTDCISELKFWNPLELALRVNNLQIDDSENYKVYKKFLTCLDANTDNVWEDIDISKLSKNSPLCIITYANAANGWFPYFFDYYKKIVGSESIYVVTPAPNEFMNLNLGGVLTTKNMVYDDFTRANFISNLATGLQNYYTWSLVCDVDEIVMPDPRLGIGLLEFLKQKNEAVLVSLGLDVIEEATDLKFDFSKPIYEQRRLAIPNSALCKPHLARKAIKYSPGYHYCNHKLGFDRFELGLLTLHLKFACSAIRAEVADIVSKTVYADVRIEEYSNVSVQRTHHPAFQTAQHNAICHLNGPEINDFKEKYMANLKNIDGMWYGENFVLPILISIEELKEKK